MSVQLCFLCLVIIVNTGISANESDVRYYFYTRSVDGIELNRNNILAINFNSSKETVFAVHGWLHSYTTEMPQMVKNAYLSSRDFNIVLVDWSNKANENYISSRYAITDIGQILGSFIQFMNEHVGLELSKTGLVGFSLGAHVVGVAGRTLNGSIDRIIGLDPAGPLFYSSSDEYRLAKEDAKFVQVIHTSGGVEGILVDMGHANYWVNGGTLVQPGCPLWNAIFCSHDRAYQYYGESLLGGKFVAQECNDYASYLVGACSANKATLMGDDAIDRSEGRFYLNTNSEAPFARG